MAEIRVEEKRSGGANWLWIVLLLLLLAALAYWFFSRSRVVDGAPAAVDTGRVGALVQPPTAPAGPSWRVTQDRPPVAAAA